MHARDVRVILEVQELVCMQEMLRDARVGMSEEHAGEVRVILEMLDFFYVRGACRSSRIILEMLEYVCSRSTQEILVILKC